MAVVKADPVGIFRAQFCGIKPTKNPDYYMLNLRFEYTLEMDFPPESHLQDSSSSHLLSSLKVGSWYYMRMTPNANKGSGDYGVRVRLSLLEVLGEAPRAGEIDFLLQASRSKSNGNSAAINANSAVPA